MRRRLFSLIVFISLNQILLSQPDEDYARLTESFESLDYQSVISLSEGYLAERENISVDKLISIFEMRGVAHYALGEKERSKNDFIEILKLNPEYSPDPVRISPKIISFFNPIKSDFQNIMKYSELSTPADTSVFVTVLSFNQSLYNGAILRSMILPGVGHIYAGDKTKGITLTALSTLLLGSSVYFIIRTNDLEKEYLRQSDPDIIRDKYSEYNSSYKIRNTLLISYAVVWIYSQIDLLFFSSSLFNETVRIRASIDPGFPFDELSLSFKIPLN